MSKSQLGILLAKRLARLRRRSLLVSIDGHAFLCNALVVLVLRWCCVALALHRYCV